MRRSPLVTIAIPTYNRKKYLQMAISSALQQSYPHIEVLVSDNASNDGTEAMMRAWHAPNLEYVRQPRNIGMVGNWNSCVQHARGDYFLLLSDDDLLDPDTIKKLLAEISQPGTAIAYSRIRYVNKALETVSVSLPAPSIETGAQFIAASLRGQRLVAPSATLYALADVQANGGYPWVGTFSDLALRLVVATRGKVRCIDTPLVHYRMHETNLSHDQTDMLNSLVALVSWANHPSCPIFRYHTLLRRYAAHFLYRFAIRRTVRGDGHQMKHIHHAARALSFHWGYELLLSIFALPPVVLLASARRWVLGRV